MPICYGYGALSLAFSEKKTAVFQFLSQIIHVCISSAIKDSYTWFRPDFVPILSLKLISRHMHLEIRARNVTTIFTEPLTLEMPPKWGAAGGMNRQSLPSSARILAIWLPWALACSKRIRNCRSAPTKFVPLSFSRVAQQPRCATKRR